LRSAESGKNKTRSFEAGFIEVDQRFKKQLGIVFAGVKS